MKYKEIYNSCMNGGECPKVLQAENGDYLVQGYALDDQVQAEIAVPAGEDLIRLPKEFFEGMLAALGK